VGEGVVVRSDDIDGNDIIGTATVGDRRFRFRATATDDCEITGSEIEPIDG
jgi:hypothetical protein